MEELDMRTIETIITRSLDEDIGSGDLTTLSIVPEAAQGMAVIIAREPGIIAGLKVAESVFHAIDPHLYFQQMIKDGVAVGESEPLAEIRGSARSILLAERVALNFLQRMSGVATRTAKFADLVRYYNAKIVDTRKTTPGLRILEKYAVRVGGGRNHRFGLFDAVLIKDNHIAIAGGVKEAIMAARHRIPHTFRVEVECNSISQIDEALELKADIILFNDMSVEIMEEAIGRIGGRVITEASGQITEENIIDIAKTGVDYISVGALTQSSKSLDISLDIEREKTI
jgi:nicotinate-nucleotide pyrophosphorylase (carboxylating)